MNIPFFQIWDGIVWPKIPISGWIKPLTKYFFAMSLVTLFLFWNFYHCNIFLSISITRPKITISYLLKPLCVWNSKISSEKDRVILIHHIYFSHMPMAKFCHIPFCQGKESGLWLKYILIKQLSYVVLENRQKNADQ